MRLKFLLPLTMGALLALAAPVTMAQDDATKFLLKARQLDLLNQILPVIMTSEQIKKILPGIERSRAAEKKLEADELAEMKKLQPKLEEHLKAAKEKGVVPDKEFQLELIKMAQGFQKNRALLALNQSMAVTALVKETLDAGQVKAAANAITMPDSDGKKLDDEARLTRWVRVVLMNPEAYDLLVDLSRKSG